MTLTRDRRQAGRSTERRAAAPRERFFDRRARPRFVAGAAAVALLFFGTRWASYLGVNPVYATDVLLVLAAAALLLRIVNRPEDLPVRTPPGGTPLFIATGLLFVLVRFAAGGDWSITAVRDALPYLYIAASLMAMFALRRAGAATRRNTLRLFLAALVLHAVWFGLQQAVPSLPDSLPLLNAVQDVHVFTPRPDVDTSFDGVLAAMILWRILHRGRHPVLLGIAYVAVFGSVAASFTRAGLLGTVVASGFVLLVALAERSRPARSRMLIAAIVPVVLIGGVVAVSFTAVGTKLVATVDPSASGGDAVATGAEGTARARANAWNRLIEWTEADGTRLAVGVGFGPDFLEESGAAPLLVGDAIDDDVRPRSPHDYWLGTLARLGVIGLALIVLAIGAMLWRSWRLRNITSDDPFTLLLILVPVALIVPASLGVVLESPFAAAPFWWCVGAVTAIPVPPAAFARLGGSTRPVG